MLLSRLPTCSLVWLSHGMHPRRATREERLERGLSGSKLQWRPTRFQITASEGSKAVGVIIGMDLQKSDGGSSEQQ